MASTIDTSSNIGEGAPQPQMPKKYISSFELYLKPEELTPQRCQRIVKYARKRLRGQDNNSVHAYDNSNTQVRIPVINHSQIELGKQLGKGAFSSVYAIKTISKKTKKTEKEVVFEDQCKGMVVKFLRTKLYDNHGLFAASAADLVKEGNILATLCHSNIIRIHAVSSKYGVGAYLNGYHDSYFLVLERLERTLSERIQEWQTRHKELHEVDELQGKYDTQSSLVGSNKPGSRRGSWKKRLSGTFQKGAFDELALEVSDRTNVTHQISDIASDLDDDDYTKTAVAKTNLLSERLDVAQQLADAIAYLHSENVLHRDLKPDNIGFDIHGDLKVFDFDIARVCPTSVESGVGVTSRRVNSKQEEETFLMTQKVGSPRYMSPECARREPYNLKADVYSYAVLAHQILTLQKPYDDISDEDHDDFVFFKGVRPHIPMALPNNTKQLLHCAWSHNISERPSMEIVRQTFSLERSEILRLGTIGQSLSAIPLTESTGYVWSCSFASLSDNNKKVKKMKMKKMKTKSKSMTLGKQSSFKNSKKNGLLSIFRKNVDKPAKKSLLSGSISERHTDNGTAWARG